MPAVQLSTPAIPLFAAPPFADQRGIVPRIENGRIDIGAVEVSDANADNDNDSLPDAWEARHGLDPNDDGSINPDYGAKGNPDGDAMDNVSEYTADTDPRDKASVFRVSGLGVGLPVVVTFASSTGRVYTLERRVDYLGASWTNVVGQTAVEGWGGEMSLTNDAGTDAGLLRVRVAVP